MTLRAVLDRVGVFIPVKYHLCLVHLKRMKYVWDYSNNAVGCTNFPFFGAVFLLLRSICFQVECAFEQPLA